MRRVVVATRNPHKLRELSQLLAGFELAALGGEHQLPEETGESFSENSLIKARSARLATGLAAIADDSGIAVAALDGRPGVRSARFAGETASDHDNLELLLRSLDGVADRRAAYVCVIAHVDEQGRESTFEGRCEGAVIAEPRGEGGFGYDPAFVPDDTGASDQRTMAELSGEEKHAISHRGRAARALAAALGR